MIAKPIPREHVLGCWIVLARLVRINELCAARWKERINFKAATWFVPSDQAKNRKAITGHLPRFALRLLRELYAITGHAPFVLPHPDDATGPGTTVVLQCAIVVRQSWGKWTKKSRSAEITAPSLVLSGGP
jgi:integrase